MLLWQGRVDEAISSMENAQRFDPQLRPGFQYDLSWAYYMAGRFRDALTQADRSLLKHPEYHNFHVIRMLALAELGDAEATRLAVEQVIGRRWCCAPCSGSPCDLFDLFDLVSTQVNFPGPA